MVIGQNEGFNFEELIKVKINNLSFKHIDNNLKNFLRDVDPSLLPNDLFTIDSTPVRRGIDRKTDFFIKKNNEKFCNVSLKTGGGNSVHQENIFSFISYLSSLGASSTDTDALLFFHWGDNSLDGLLGRTIISNRMSSVEIKRRYPQKISQINQMLHRFKIPILERVFLGQKDGNQPDYLLYVGTYSLANLKFASMNKVVDLHSNNYFGKNVKIGNLNLQNWNRCLEGQDLSDKSSKHRNDIQFKWPTISKDL